MKEFVSQFLRVCNSVNWDGVGDVPFPVNQGLYSHYEQGKIIALQISSLGGIYFEITGTEYGQTLKAGFIKTTTDEDMIVSGLEEALRNV